MSSSGGRPSSSARWSPDTSSSRPASRSARSVWTSPRSASRWTSSAPTSTTRTQDGLELPGADEPAGGAVPVLRGLGRAGVAVPAGGPVPGDPAAAVPGHGDQRVVDRRVRRQLSVLPGPAPAGGVEPGRAGRPAGRVLALAFAALRRRDLLGWHPRAQPAARPDLRRTGRRRRRSCWLPPSVIGDCETRSDVGVLVSAESRWAMEFMAPLSAPGAGWFGDKNSYERILAAFYRGLLDAGLAADVVAPAPAAGRRRDGPPVAGAGRARASTSPTTNCCRGSASTPRPAGTSSSRRAPATRTRRPSPGTR